MTTLEVFTEATRLGLAAHKRHLQHEEFQRRTELAWHLLVSTMAAEHYSRIVLELGGWKAEPTAGLGGVTLLAVMANRMVKAAARGRWFTPLALPPAVCQVYLQDLDARPQHECEDCAFPVPVRPSTQDEQERVYFERCPICAGATGRYAYYLKHMARPVDRLPGRHQAPNLE